MATGDQAFFANRLRSLLPRGWFGDPGTTPFLDGILAGLGYLHAHRVRLGAVRQGAASPVDDKRRVSRRPGGRLPGNCHFAEVGRDGRRLPGPHQTGRLRAQSNPGGHHRRRPEPGRHYARHGRAKELLGHRRICQLQRAWGRWRRLRGCRRLRQPTPAIPGFPYRAAPHYRRHRCGSWLQLGSQRLRLCPDAQGQRGPIRICFGGPGPGHHRRQHLRPYRRHSCRWCGDLDPHRRPDARCWRPPRR